VRPARAAGAAGSPILFFAMAMAGTIGGAQWPPADSLSDFETKFFYPLAHQRRAPNTRKKQGDC
jgi:hypothetical protein